jgi:hypothetical protein
VLVRGRWLSKDELAHGMEALAGDYARENAFMSRFTPAGLDEALAHLHSVRAQDPKAFLFRPEGLESLALLFGLIRNHSAARIGAELAVEEFPARWTAWTRLAEACLALEDEPGARAALEHALALHPGDARIQRELEGLAGD